MSITLELSPEIEKQLAAMSAEERTRFVADAVQEKIESMEEEHRLTPEDIESLKRGAADSDAGRVSDGWANLAATRAALGMPPYQAS